jgi:hypothetical protein
MFSEGDCRMSSMRRIAIAGRIDSALPISAVLILPFTLARSRRDLVSQRSRASLSGSHSIEFENSNLFRTGACSSSQELRPIRN